tara:strand:- start:1112 stop:2593 length:1482 start_codon:yes stop_codon:yes gene_type:complete
MANGNLIQGARRLGQSKRFIDYGKILTRSIDTSKLDKALEEGRERYYRQQKEYEAKLGNYLSQKGTLDLTKVPDHAMSAVKDQLTAQKNAYAAAATAAAQAKVGSEEYNTAIDQMNSANNIIRNLDANLSGAATTIAEMQEAFDSQEFSKGNPDYNKYIQAIGDPNAENGPKYIFDDSGNLSIQLFDDNGNPTETVAAKDLNKFFRKANEQINNVTALAGQAEARGLSGLKYDEKQSRRQIAMALTDNRENLLSLARDAFVLDKPIISDADMETELYEGLTGRELLLRENQTQLKNFLTDKYIDAVKTGYDNGRSVYDEKKNEGKEKENVISGIDEVLEEHAESSVVYVESDQIGPTMPTIIDGNKEINEDASQERFAQEVAGSLNSGAYGSQTNEYFSRDAIVAQLMDMDVKELAKYDSTFANKSYSDGTDIGENKKRQDILNFLTKRYPDKYLFRTGKGRLTGFASDYKNPAKKSISLLFSAAGIKVGVLD